MRPLAFIAFIVVLGSCSDPDPKPLTEEPTPFPVVDLGDFPGTERVNAYGFSVKGKGYIHGGRSGWLGGGSNSDKHFDELWEYAPGSNSWARKADHPIMSYQPPMIIDDTVYFLDSQMSVWAFEATSDIWTKKAEFPGTLRIGFVTMSLAGTLYVGLGWGTVINSFFNDWWEYDPSTNSWHQMSNVPFEGRSGSFCWSISNRGYLAFGYAESGSTFDDFWEYDPAKDSWIEKNAKGLRGSIFRGKEEYVLTIGDKPTILLGTKPEILKVFQYDFDAGEWKVEYEWANKFNGGMTTFSIGSSHYFLFGQSTEYLFEQSSAGSGSSNKVWVFNEH